MAFKVRREELPKEKTKHSCTKDWRVTLLQRSVGWLSTLYWAGSLATSKEVLETKQEQHFGQEGSRPPASAWGLLAVFPGISQVPVGSTCGSCWSTSWGFSETAMKKKWRFGFLHDLGLLGNAQWLWGPSKSNKGSNWYSPINTQKSSKSILDEWEDKNQWIKGLYPSTINKVHHEWRL